MNAHHATREFFREHDTLLITNSDKSKKTVIMEKTDYDSKMLELLSDRDVYETIDTDPTNDVNKKCTTLINGMKERKIITAYQHRTLKVGNPLPPRIYGLPKLHKMNIPLRPIVSTINSPPYKLAKFCCNTLKELTLSSHFNIKNSFAFKEFVHSCTLNNDDILISFDVVSLFTNIPAGKAKRVISKRWEELKFYTPLSKDEFLEIIDVCIKDGNYFKYGGRYYRQKHGLAMGSPLSPILADIVLEDLFEKMIPKLPHPPTFIKKYVDDLCIAIPEQYIEPTLNTFNTYHPKIKFTVEKEVNGALNFLDMTLKRENNRISTVYYSKETTSSRILNFLSNHPYKMKINIAHSFIRRTINLTDSRFIHEIKPKIRSVLIENNYPPKVIDKLITKSIYTYRNPNLARKNNPPTNTHTIFGAITYVPNLTEKITKTLKPESQNIKVGTKIVNKLGSIFTPLKDRIPNDQKSDVIYEIPCECGKKYIGQTTRKLKTRIMEHNNIAKKTVHFQNQHFADPNEERPVLEMRDLTNKSGIAKHIVETSHNIKFDKSKIIEVEPNNNKRVFKENCHIWMTNNINLKLDTEKLQSTYNIQILLRSTSKI